MIIAAGIHHNHHQHRPGCVWVVIITLTIMILHLPGHVILAGDDQKAGAGNIPDVDDFLKQRAEKAIIEAMKAYQPHPEEVTKTFTQQVSQSLENDKQAPRKQLKPAPPARSKLLL